MSIKIICATTMHTIFIIVKCINLTIIIIIIINIIIIISKL